MKYVNRLIKSEVPVYVLIIVVQLLIIAYWTNCKTNYHVDELYSMGYADGIYSSQEYWVKIPESADFVWEDWISASDLKKHLVLSESEKIFNAPFSRIINVFMNERSYFALLNLAESVVGSSKGGVLLNFIFFVVSEICLVLLMKRLNMDKTIKYLSLAMFGFSAYILSAATFIRFYMFIIMLFLIILNLCYTAWDADSWGVVIFDELLALILVYFSFKNSELVIPFFAVFWICFVIASLVRKKRKQSITGLWVCAIGIIYVVSKTSILSYLIRPGDNQKTVSVWSGSSSAIIESITNLSTYTIMDFFMWIKGLFETHYFATRPILYILLCAITLCLVFTSYHDGKYSINLKRINPVATASLLFWLGILGASFILGHGKEVSMVMIYGITIIMFVQSIGLKIRNLVPELSSDSFYILILFVAAIASIIFGDLCSFRIWRYYCYGFVSLTIVFWYAIDRIIKRPELAHSRHSLMVILVIFVFINSILPFKIRNVEYIFEDEKGIINSISEMGDLNVVLLLTSNDSPNHTLYDCINMVNDNTKIFVADLEQYKYGRMDYPDKFILWAHSETDMDSVIADLEINGFGVDELGTDHCSRMFVVALK